MTSPDESDPPYRAEVAFHVRELAADVRGMRARLDRDAGTAALLGELWAGLEHDTGYHGARLRSLLRHPTTPSEDVTGDSPGSEVALAEARYALDTADELLTGALREADPAQALRAVDVLDAVLPMVQAAAEKLDSAAPPAEPWPVPARELLHSDARVLTSCPFCGAPLGPDDRTFTGSFCEACGTRWSEGTQGAPDS